MLDEKSVGNVDVVIGIVVDLTIRPHITRIAIVVAVHVRRSSPAGIDITVVDVTDTARRENLPLIDVVVRVRRKNTVGKRYIAIYRKTIWVHTNYIIFFKTSRVRRK